MQTYFCVIMISIIGSGSAAENEPRAISDDTRIVQRIKGYGTITIEATLPAGRNVALPCQHFQAVLLPVKFYGLCFAAIFLPSINLYAGLST